MSLTTDEQKITSQENRITDLENELEGSRFEIPLLKIAEGVLMVPLMGTMDSVKSQKVMEDILINIKLNETKVVVIDIAGITVIDSSVAAHLIKIAKATNLMGCKSIVSGISPIIATNIVNLGVDVSDIETTNTLKDSMVKAYNYIGYELVKKN
ncbi:STAS domain-containing protein [Sulfurospirillum arcachonense]|uniref:STAS domain-containing protein n=1 Tax=Sulfurospirillum arcachonense TaxID=57666 RepID=UPI000469D319|nr:STAS domain-containing protein [Sulfurospirillum arcachonense]